MSQENHSRTDIDSGVKRSVLLVASLASFVTPLMGSAVNVALPTIGKELSMDVMLLGWVATSYILASAILLIPFGRLADIVGRKKIFGYGMILFTTSSLFCALSTGATSLIVSRFVQGISSAMIFSTSVAIITSVYPTKERGRALGYVVASVYLGLSIGPFIGGVLTENFGWRSIFYMAVPFGAVSTALLFAKLKGEWRENKGESFDWFGSLLLSLSFSLFIYAMTILPDTRAIILTAFSFLCAFFFIHYERKIKYPVIKLSLFRRNRTFAFSNIAALINYSATFAVGFLLSLYLQYVKGFTPQYSGFILVSQPIIMALLSPYAGKISDRREARVIASIGMGITTVGIFLLSLLNAQSGTFPIIVMLLFNGAGFALFSSPNQNAIMGAVEKNQYGVAAATLATSRMVGQTLSMALAALILSSFTGRNEVTQENSSLFLQGMKLSLVIFSILSFAGIFASLARGKK